MKLQIAKSTGDGVEIVPGEWDNEDRAAAECDRLMNETEQLHFVFAPIYSPMFGWIQQNKPLWAKPDEIDLNL